MAKAVGDYPRQHCGPATEKPWLLSEVNLLCNCGAEATGLFLNELFFCFAAVKMIISFNNGIHIYCRYQYYHMRAHH
jgi:hypothetical protein